MNRTGNKLFLPLIIVFIILNALILVLKRYFENAALNQDFVIIANLFFFILSLVGFFVQRRGLQSDNPNVFIRGVYTAILIKLFVSIIAVLSFAFISRKSINAQAIFISLGLYIIYTSIEVAALMKVAKRKSNAKERITS